MPNINMGLHCNRRFKIQTIDSEIITNQKDILDDFIVFYFILYYRPLYSLSGISLHQEFHIKEPDRRSRNGLFNNLYFCYSGTESG